MTDEKSGNRGLQNSVKRLCSLVVTVASRVGLISSVCETLMPTVSLTLELW